MCLLPSRVKFLSLFYLLYSLNLGLCPDLQLRISFLHSHKQYILDSQNMGHPAPLRNSSTVHFFFLCGWSAFWRSLFLIPRLTFKFPLKQEVLEPFLLALFYVLFHFHLPEMGYSRKLVEQNKPHLLLLLRMDIKVY